MTDNPLLAPFTAPFGAPPFPAVTTADYEPAFDAAMAEHRAEIDAITSQAEPPSFANTLVKLELSGQLLDRVAGVFYNLTSADTNEALNAIQLRLAPIMARHGNAISLDAALFARIDDLYQRRDTMGLKAEDMRVLEQTWKNFVRAGARLSGDARERMKVISERLATLGTQFAQNVLKDEADWFLPLSADDVTGLPDFLTNAMAEAAKGKNAPFGMTLSRSMVEPFLTLSPRRDLREKVFNAWVRRGENPGPTHNGAIITEMVQLRAERARLLGYRTFAAFKLDDTMAKTPEAVEALLKRVWAPAKKRFAEEKAELEALAHAEGLNGAIGAADWRYYAEKLRQQRHALDEALLKPYFQLDRMIEAAFETAGKLFGVSFAERHDVPVYHPDVRVWEVSRKGVHIGLFYGDYFARPSKRSGAWMSSFRSQHNLGETVRPLIVNVMNFAKPPAGKSALLSVEDARTLFHEFGHALHGLLSDVTYPLLSGTAVARDFVEFPSQVYEHWLLTPDILTRFATHVDTGEPLPQAMMQRLIAASTFNQGFKTVEYVSSALVDMAFHALENPGAIDPLTFEAETLDKIGMPDGIVMRHRTPHFAHVFTGDGYSAGYYSYLWSEVLDADGFMAFEATGNVFDPALARRLHDNVYAAGNSSDPLEAYVAFRGQQPDPDALLKKRGLAA